MAKLCMRVGKELGHRMTTLDLGGGYAAGDLSESTVQIL